MNKIQWVLVISLIAGAIGLANSATADEKNQTQNAIGSCPASDHDA